MSTHSLSLTTSIFEDLIKRVHHHPGEPIDLPMGLGVQMEHCQWLVRPWGTQERDDSAPRLRVFGIPTRTVANSPIPEFAIQEPLPGPRAFLALGYGEALGHLAAWCQTSQGWHPMERVTVIGRGLRHLDLSPPPGPGVSFPATDVGMSRTADVLGIDTMRQIRQMHLALIGCGRSGSLAAEAWASLGVGRLSLIDPDHLEWHNLGEMALVTPDDLGRSKAQGVADGLRRQFPASPTLLDALTQGVQDLPALFSLKKADMILSYPDSPAARLAAAALATLYLKPLLDVGTGIVRASGLPEDPPRGSPRRRMGFDVRLILPGRCLVCLGSLPQLSTVLESLTRPRGTPRPVPFRRERLGSLRSLNSLAVSLGQTLVEQFLTGRIDSSVWIQGNVAEDGLPRWEMIPQSPRPGCPLCRLTGMGDEGLPLLATTFLSLSAPATSQETDDYLRRMEKNTS